VITWRTIPTGTIRQNEPTGICPSNFPISLGGSVTATDDHDSGRLIRVVLSWSAPGFQSGSVVMNPDGLPYYGAVGPVPYPGNPNNGGVLAVSVVATDSQGATSNVLSTKVTIAPCQPIIIG
jgi:putative peptide zinc metalloprotease protein